MGEFDLIDRYFKHSVQRADLGVGDDCALLSPRAGYQLAVSTDTLIEGRHFLSTVPPDRLGHKCLAVNLSDLAACGAEPRAFLLALSLPTVDESWLAGFSHGLMALAEVQRCELIGGDTTRGPLAITITVLGDVPQGQALLRSGAQAGDDIYVSGHLGDARLALECFRGNVRLPEPVFAACRQRMEQPQPRVALGIALRGLASAMADISDGLVGDLGHILLQSGCGAHVDLQACEHLLACHPHVSLSPELLRTCVFAGGDDYELVFTAPPKSRAAISKAAYDSQTPVHRIGTITATPGLHWIDRLGHPVPLSFSSFDHFAC